jgi:hypothetical protein
MLRKQLVADLVLRVMEENVVVVPKRGLIWRLGWSNDKPGVWKSLLDIWVECGGDRKELHGIEFGGKVMLVYGKPPAKIAPVFEWAEEDEWTDAAA